MAHRGGGRVLHAYRHFRRVLYDRTLTASAQTSDIAGAKDGTTTAAG
jgi:hypothetical protein